MPALTASTPMLRVSRPALELLSRLVDEARETTLADAVAATDKPRSTVTRWLSELVDAGLLMRLMRDSYSVPSRPAQALLLVEPSPYARSLLLHQDVLSRARLEYAFACIPVRKNMPFDLSRAAPVLNLRDRRVESLPAAVYPDAFRAEFAREDVGSELLRFPSDSAAAADAIGRRFPVLTPELALSLFAASGDPRIVQATLVAAERMGIPHRKIAARASGLSIEEPPLTTHYPNAVLLPRWLSKSFGAASRLHTSRYLSRDARPPDDVAGEDE